MNYFGRSNSKYVVHHDDELCRKFPKFAQDEPTSAERSNHRSTPPQAACYEERVENEPTRDHDSSDSFSLRQGNNQQRIDNFAKLPSDLVIHILTYLDASQVELHVSNVNPTLL